MAGGDIGIGVVTGRALVLRKALAGMASSGSQDAGRAELGTVVVAAAVDPYWLARSWLIAKAIFSIVVTP